MTNYNLLSYLFVLLLLIAVVLGVILAGSYSLVIMPARVWSLYHSVWGDRQAEGESGQEAGQSSEEAVLGESDRRPSGFVGYPVVRPKRQAEDVFGPGAVAELGEEKEG